MNLTNYKFTYILIGNKTDDRDNRKISVDDGNKLSLGFDGNFLETSGKDNKYIIDLFEMLIRCINEKKLDIKRNDESDRKNNLKRKNEFEFFHIFQIKKSWIQRVIFILINGILILMEEFIFQQEILVELQFKEIK